MLFFLVTNHVAKSEYIMCVYDGLFKLTVYAIQMNSLIQNSCLSNLINIDNGPHRPYLAGHLHRMLLYAGQNAGCFLSMNFNNNCNSAACACTQQVVFTYGAGLQPLFTF